MSRRITEHSLSAIVVLLVLFTTMTLIADKADEHIHTIMPITGLAGPLPGGCNFGVSDPDSVYVDPDGGASITVEIGQEITTPLCSWSDTVATECTMNLLMNVTSGNGAPSQSTEPLGCPDTNASCYTMYAVSEATPTASNIICRGLGIAKVYCNSGATRSPGNDDITVTCQDTTEPTIDMTTPINTTGQDDDINFECTGTDNWDLNRVNLWIYTATSNTWTLNYSETGLNGDSNTLSTTINDIPSGNNYFKCEYIDDYGLASNSSNSSFEVSPATPSASIQAPATSYSYATNIPIQYTQTNADTCYYSINGVENITLDNCGNDTLNMTTEGTHNFKLYARNGDEIDIQETTFNVTTEVNVTLEYPGGPTDSVTTEDLDFNFTVSATDPVNNCSLIFLVTTNETTYNVTQTSTQTITVENIAENTYIWNIQCSIPTETANGGSNRLVTVTTPVVSPDVNISLEGPNDGIIDDDGAVTFSFTANATNTIRNCSLIINNTINFTNSSISSTNVYQSYEINFDHGSYEWMVSCYDYSDNYNLSSTRTFYVDTADNDNPAVTIVSPADGLEDSDGVVQFIYQVSDNSSIENCSLLVDSTIVNTDTSITKDLNQLISYTFSAGDYEWQIGCYDESGNYGVSTARDLTVSGTTTTEAPEGTNSKIDERRAQIWNEIKPNTLYKMSLKLTRIPVYQILFQTESKAINSRLGITSYIAVPNEVPKPKTLTYAYFEIERENLDELSLSSVFVNIRKSWLRENGIGSIALFRLEGNEWRSYQGELIGEDSVNEKYRIDLPGFSKFYLGALDKFPTTETEKEAQIELPSVKKPLVGKPTAAIEQPTTMPKEAKIPIYLLFSIFLGIVIIGLVYWVRTGKNAGELMNEPKLKGAMNNARVSLGSLKRDLSKQKKETETMPKASFEFSASIEFDGKRKFKRVQKKETEDGLKASATFTKKGNK